MPATRMRRRGDRRGAVVAGERLDLVGREEEAVAGLLAEAEVAAGVVVDATASLMLPSRSWSMPSITAVRPASARSKTSPPARGLSRTRERARSSTPSTVTASGPGRSSSSQ